MFRPWIYGTGLVVAFSFLLGTGLQADASMQSQRQLEQGEKGKDQSGVHGQWQKLSGTIKKMKTVTLNKTDQDNVVVQVESRHGGKRIVDLGNVENLQEIDLQTGDRITAWGKSMNIGERKVFMARKLKANGKKIRLERPELSQLSQQTRRQHQTNEEMQQSAGGDQQAYSGQRRIKGEVVMAGEIVAYDQRGPFVQYDRDGFYVVEEPNGRQAHLLVAERMDPGFNVGDRIQAKVRPDGSVVSISRTSSSNGRSQGQQQSASSQSGSRWDREGNRKDSDVTRDRGGQQGEDDRQQTARQSSEDED